MAKIIILNGTSSSGKSILAKALQSQFDEPYLHVGIDNYIFMLPKQYLNQPLWSTIFRYQYAEDGTIETIETGNLGQQLISAMHHAIKALADAGFHVIVDHVLLERVWFDEMVDLFTGHQVWFIGIRCPLDILEEREETRKDRTLGQAKAQFDVVHKHNPYDFEIDTSILTPEEAAQQIKAQLHMSKQETVFAKAGS